MQCIARYIPSVLTEGILSTGGLGGPGGRAPSICARPAKRRGPTLAGPYRFPTRPCFTCDPRADMSMLCIDCTNTAREPEWSEATATTHASSEWPEATAVPTARMVRASGRTAWCMEGSMLICIASVHIEF